MQLILINIIKNTFSVDCLWSLWRKQGGCSRTCGSGKQTLVRTKTRKEENGGYCDNKSTMVEDCELPACPGTVTGYL